VVNLDPHGIVGRLASDVKRVPVNLVEHGYHIEAGQPGRLVDTGDSVSELRFSCSVKAPTGW
jgi:hypothetical protein